MKVRTSNWQKCGPEAVEGQKQVPEEATVLKIRTRRLHFRSKQKLQEEAQEDPEPGVDSECKMNRVEIKAEKESGDVGFRRELRNSLWAHRTLKMERPPPSIVLR